MNATMIIECPKCGTKYNVIPEAIKPRGRTVHCTTCSNKWHVDPTVTETEAWPEQSKAEPEIDVPAEPEEEEDEFHRQRARATAQEVEEESHSEAEPVEPEPVSVPEADEVFMVARPQVSSELDEGHGARINSLALLAASVAILTLGIFGLHGQVERVWPASARLYQATGLKGDAAPGQGLEIKDAHAYLAGEGQGQVLTIEARIVNPQKTAILLPSLDAWLMADNGPAKHWMVKPDIEHLDSGDSTIVKASVDGDNTQDGKILLTFSADNSVKSK